MEEERNEERRTSKEGFQTDKSGRVRERRDRRLVRKRHKEDNCEQKCVLCCAVVVVVSRPAVKTTTGGSGKREGGDLNGQWW